MRAGSDVRWSSCFRPQPLAAATGSVCTHPWVRCPSALQLAADDVDEWLAAGVDAVALGASLVGDQAWSRLEQWLADHHP